MASPQSSNDGLFAIINIFGLHTQNYNLLQKMIADDVVDDGNNNRSSGYGDDPNDDASMLLLTKT